MLSRDKRIFSHPLAQGSFLAQADRCAKIMRSVVMLTPKAAIIKVEISIPSQPFKC